MFMDPDESLDADVTTVAVRRLRETSDYWRSWGRKPRQALVNFQASGQAQGWDTEVCGRLRAR